MSERQETIADIIAEMRGQAGNDGYPLDIKHYSDRLEAAHKREIDGPKKQVGNAAKLREALEHIVRVGTYGSMERDDLCGRCLEKMFARCNHDGTCWVDKAITALAAPPRNCDIGTTTEQSDRMRHFCLYDQGGCGGCSRRNKGMTFRECVIDWGQMPYEAKEGGAK